MGLVVNSKVFEKFIAVFEVFLAKFSKVNVLVCPSFTKIGTASVTNILFGKMAIAFCSPSEKFPAFATTLIMIDETLFGTFIFQLITVFPFSANEKLCSLLNPETAVSCVIPNFSEISSLVNASKICICATPFNFLSTKLDSFD